MDGLHVLVTAGGTREPIDPVRFIGNRSSGKQGHAIAEAAADRGATVTLVTTTTIATSPVHRADPGRHRGADARGGDPVVAPTAQVVVMAAAVADFAPVHVAGDKLKKRDGVPVVELRPTVDILAELGRHKAPDQTLVGFAAETDDLVAHATAKLESKGLDLLVANDVSAPGVGFEHDTNEVLILFPDGHQHHVPLSDKRSVAHTVLDAVAGIRSNDSTQTGR